MSQPHAYTDYCFNCQHRLTSLTHQGNRIEQRCGLIEDVHFFGNPGVFGYFDRIDYDSTNKKMWDRIKKHNLQGYKKAEKYAHKAVLKFKDDFYERAFFRVPDECPFHLEHTLHDTV